MSAEDLTERIERLNWSSIGDALDVSGFAKLGGLLHADECASLIAIYDDPRRFRKRIDMARLKFGVGEYKYFVAPLPPLVEQLRANFYRHLAPIANRWSAALARRAVFARELSGFLSLCHRAGQTLPTPLLLRYETGGYNCLHQDLYGEIAFPLQLTCVLSRCGGDFEGGEFLLVEQRPRAQSRGEAITLGLGDAIIFPNAQRPVLGARGTYRVNVRHGVSTLRAGLRYSLGVIFHDAK